MSFTDMMSSGRGPGVIGMVMALFVLLGFGVLFIFAFDEGLQGGDQSIESVIIHQAKEIDGYHSNIIFGQQKLDQTPARVAGAKELGRINRGNLALRETVANLTKGIETGKAAIALKIQEFEDYKDQYRAYVRGKAKGEAIAKLETLTGAVYNEVSIREVTAIGIQIRHGDGHKRIPFEELPEAMKDRFQFDPKQKIQALAQESASRNEHEAAVAVTDGLTDQANAARRAADSEAARRNTIQTIAIKESRIAALEVEIKQLDKAIPLEERKRLSRAGIMREEIAGKRQEVSELRAQISSLQRRL